jgi:hypothetical protein
MESKTIYANIRYILASQFSWWIVSAKYDISPSVNLLFLLLTNKSKINNPESF